MHMIRRGLIAAVATVLMLSACGGGEGSAEPVDADGTGTPTNPQDAEAQNDLVHASVVATNFGSAQRGYGGFTAEEAEGFDSSLDWSDAGPAEAGVISIRDVSKKHIVLVTKSKSGAVLCISEDGGAEATGMVDAQSLAECTGGW